MYELIRKAARHDAEAFIELMEQNMDAMARTARAILHNEEDAADAVQDTILTCYEKLDTLRKPEYFKTWLIRILINHCYKTLKHNSHIYSDENIPEIPIWDSGTETIEFRELMMALDEKYRLPVILYYVDELKVNEIASLLDMKESTVKTRLRRAREQIRRYMDENER